MERRDEGLDLTQLSPREREVLDVALEGLSAREIAARLSVSEPTVRSHLSAIYARLGVSGRVELLARLNGATSTPGVPPTPPAPAPPGRKRRRLTRRRWLLAAGVAVLVGLGATAAWRASPHGAPRTDLPAVARLVAAGQVSALSLQNETLVVTERSAALQVDGVSMDAFGPLGDAAARTQTEVHIEHAPDTPWLVLVAEFGPLLLIGLVAIAFAVRLWRFLGRPPAPAPR